MKVLILTIGNGINILINFLTLPYLVRTLSYTDYGSYGQVLIVISFLQGLFTFNLHQVANIYLASKNEDPKMVFSSLMRTSIFSAFIAICIMGVAIIPVAGSFSNPQLKPLLLYSLINLGGQVPVPILISVLIFYGRVKISTSILISTNILKIAVMFVAIHFYHSVSILMAGLSFVSVFQVLILYSVIPRNIRTIAFTDKRLVKSFMAMATPLTITGVVERSVVYMDGIMVSTILATGQYALYRAGSIEVPFISSLYGSVTAIVMPEVARLFASDDLKEILRMKRKVIVSTAFFVYPVLVYLLFFSKEIVTFYLSAKYAESAVVFMIFNLALFVRINDYQDILIISGHTKFIFKSVIFIVILNIILNYILIKTIGIEGGAIAFVSVLFIFAGILTYKTCNLLKCSFNDLFNTKALIKILLVSAFLCLPVYFIHLIFAKTPWFIIGIAPVYLIFAYLLGIKLELISNEIFDPVIIRFPFLKPVFNMIYVNRNS